MPTPDSLQSLIDQAESDKEALGEAVATKTYADAASAAAQQAAAQASADLGIARSKLSGTRDQLTDLVSHLYDPGTSDTSNAVSFAKRK
jgi:hypothetical protein